MKFSMNFGDTNFIGVANADQYINVKIRMYNCDYLRMSTLDLSSDVK